jgi:hypothetical protein
MEGVGTGHRNARWVIWLGVVYTGFPLAVPLSHADWLEWGGPTRDFQPPSRGLAESWPILG